MTPAIIIALAAVALIAVLAIQFVANDFSDKKTAKDGTAYKVGFITLMALLIVVLAYDLFFSKFFPIPLTVLIPGVMILSTAAFASIAIWKNFDIKISHKSTYALIAMAILGAYSLNKGATAIKAGTMFADGNVSADMILLIAGSALGVVLISIAIKYIYDMDDDED